MVSLVEKPRVCLGLTLVVTWCCGARSAVSPPGYVSPGLVLGPDISCRVFSNPTLTPVNVSLIPYSLGCQAWVCGALGRRWADCFGETGRLADLPQSGAGWHELEAYLDRKSVV